MKRSFLLTVLLLCAIVFFSQQITRGPEIGELYFMGPAATDVLYGAIYHSTDFGVSALCVDSITAVSTSIYSITADKTVGGLYYSTVNDLLFYSNNFGSFGSWEYKNNGSFSVLCSGIEEGFIFKGCGAHSEDFGNNFTNHNLFGLFGSLVSADIGENSKGYALTNIILSDSLCFFVSNDNYNSNILSHVFNFYGNGSFYYLSSAANENGIYYYNSKYKELWYSGNDGNNWALKNCFTCPNLPINGIAGGRQDGEIYLLVVYRQFLGYIRHVYIYHSVNYGESFTVNHPVSIGNDPVYADFQANDTLGKPPFEVYFTDLSSGGLGYWEWDFNNDGITDSYQQNPTFIYYDTGYYTVELKGSYSVITDSAIRCNYIHVTNLTNIIEADQQENVELACFPNPFNENVTITLTSTVNEDPGYITIFDVSGLFIDKIKLGKTGKKYEYITNWDGRNHDGNRVKQGVYYLLSKNKSCSIKTILIN